MKDALRGAGMPRRSSALPRALAPEVFTPEPLSLLRFASDNEASRLRTRRSSSSCGSAPALLRCSLLLSLIGASMSGAEAGLNDDPEALPSIYADFAQRSSFALFATLVLRRPEGSRDATAEESREHSAEASGEVIAEGSGAGSTQGPDQGSGAGSTQGPDQGSGGGEQLSTRILQDQNIFSLAVGPSLPPNLLAKWPQWPPEKKAEFLYAYTSSQRDGIPFLIAMEVNRRQLVPLLGQLAQTHDREAREVWWRQLSGSEKLHVKRFVDLLAFLEKSASGNPLTVIDRATRIQNEASLKQMSSDEPYFAALWRDIDDWVDLSRLNKSPLSALDYLRLNYQQRGIPMNFLDPNYKPLAPIHPGALDGAAVLYAKANKALLKHTLFRGLQDARAAFQLKVEQEIGERRVGSLLLPLGEGPLLGTSIGFDGSAVYGAMNQSCEEIAATLGGDERWLRTRLNEIDRENLRGYAQFFDKPRFEGESMIDVGLRGLREALPRLLHKRFATLLENTDYRFGTPLQSMATIITRLGPMHGVSSEGIGVPSTMLERFQELERGWDERPRFPISPTLAAAFHLFNSGNGLLLTAEPVAEQLQKRVEDLYNPSFRAVAADGQTEIDVWLLRHGFALWDDFLAIVDSDQLPTAPPLLRAAVAHYQRLLALPERMVCSDPADTASKLLFYLHERFAAYVPQDRNAAPVDAEVSASRNALPTQGRAVAVDQPVDSLTLVLREHLRLEGKPLTEENLAALRARYSPVVRADAEPTLITELEDALTQLLVTSTLSHEVEKGATVMDLIPFVRPLFKIGEGVLKQNAAEAMDGAFGFGMDALLIWLGGVGDRALEASIARSAKQMMLALQEQRSLSMFSLMHEWLGKAPVGNVPAGGVMVNSDPFNVLVRDHNIPPTQRRQAALAREKGLSDPIFHGSGSRADYRLTYSEVLDRVVPVHMRELPAASDAPTEDEASQLSEARTTLEMRYSEPGSGRVDLSPAPMFCRLAEICSPPTASAADDGGEFPNWAQWPSKETPASSGKTAMTFGSGPRRTAGQLHRLAGILGAASRFLERYTVERVEEFITRMGQTRRPGLGQRRRSSQVRDFMDVLDTDNSNEAAHILTWLGSALKRSPTLHTLFTHAVDEGRLTAENRYMLRVVRFARPTTSFETRTVAFPPSPELKLTSYHSVSGATPFQKERAWVHECMHMLTGAHDPDRELAAAHRGPVVYFTDKILFELGISVPERITYASVPPTGEGLFAKAVGRSDGRQLSQRFIEMMVEDAHLDRVWKEKTRTSSYSQKILGQDPAARFTVRQVSGFRWDAAAWARDYAGRRATFEHRFHSRLSFVIDPTSLYRIQDAHTLVLRTNDFYLHDEGFRYIAEQWLEKAERKGVDWCFIFKRERRPKITAYGAQGWAVDEESCKVTVYDEPIYYLSEDGPRPLDIRRRMLGALVDMVFSASTYSKPLDSMDRGVRVYMENRFLMRDTMPPIRTSQRFSYKAADLLPETAKARRVAHDEDDFLTSREEDRSKDSLSAGAGCSPSGSCMSLSG